MSGAKGLLSCLEPLTKLLGLRATQLASSEGRSLPIKDLNGVVFSRLKKQVEGQNSMNPLVQERLKNCQMLPSLPGAALQILQLCESADPDLIKMTENSPFYGLRREVHTLSHALSLLGANSVRTLALSFSLVQGLRRDASEGRELPNYWRRSLISGIASRALGDWAQMPQKEELFLVSLLQDVGMLALREAFPEMYANLVEESQGRHETLLQLEQEELECDHGEVSSWLARQWHLPEIYQLALRFSHDPDPSAVPEDSLSFVKFVALSGLLADIWVGGDTAGATNRAKAAVSESTRMSGEDLQSILERIAETQEEVSSIFEVSLGSPESTKSILDQANQALAVLSMETVRDAYQASVKAEGLASRNQQLKELAERDALTGLYNRAHLDRILGKEFEWAKERGIPMSLVFLDIDNFKEINDKCGHQAGDQVLAGVAKTVSEQIRKMDTLTRFGGEELVLLLPNTDKSGAGVISERIREAVATETRGIALVKSVHVTVSLGYATQSPEEPFDGIAEILRAADKALYQAKSAGKNRSVAFSASDLASPKPLQSESWTSPSQESQLLPVDGTSWSDLRP